MATCARTTGITQKRLFLYHATHRNDSSRKADIAETTHDRATIDHDRGCRELKAEADRRKRIVAELRVRRGQTLGFRRRRFGL